MPSVSVLLPFRDAAATLAEAVDSVLAQTGVDFELLAIDDGSSDGGGRMVERLVERDRRVRSLKTGPRGLVHALDFGAQLAKGRYFARMDADDVCLAGRFAKQLAALEADPRLGLVGTCVEAFPSDAVEEGLARYVDWQNAVLTPEDHRRELFVESPLCHPSVMMRRDAFHAVGGYRDPAWAEDYDLWLRFDAAGYAMAKVPEVLLRWRHRPGRLTFTDPRYAENAFREARAAFLPRRLQGETRPVTIWGAGPTGKRMLRALEPHGFKAIRFIDIDPRKVGGEARGLPVTGPENLSPQCDFVLVAVGARGARSEIRDALNAKRFVEGADFLCVA